MKGSTQLCHLSLGTLLGTIAVSAMHLPHTEVDADGEIRSLLSSRTLLHHSEQRDPQLVFNHLAKAGGSFVKDVLEKVVPAESLHIENEADELTESDVRGDSFIVGIIRNPFDYYVSLWAYTSKEGTCCFKKALTPAQRSSLLSVEEVPGSTEADRARFESWMRTISKSELGLMSQRFYGSYLDQGSLFSPHLSGKKTVAGGEAGFGVGGILGWGATLLGAPGLGFAVGATTGLAAGAVTGATVPRIWNGSPWHYKTVSDATTDSKRRTINDELSAFTAEDGRVNCWVKEEDMGSTLEHCLHLFESYANRSIVDWEIFSAAMENSGRNAAYHAPCSQMYDDSLLQFVACSDKNLIRAFGYSTGCEDDAEAHDVNFSACA